MNMVYTGAGLLPFRILTNLERIGSEVCECVPLPGGYIWDGI